MDLPTCPSCGQSVLDDDAAECPFCGASMTGEPSPPKPAAPPPKPTPAEPAATSKPAAAASAGAAKSKPAAGAGPGAAKAKPSGKAAGTDPFDIAKPTAKAVARVSRKKAPGRTLKVVCPMCETAGYVPPQAAGKDVRCANAECMVPVFTAPEIETKSVVEEPEPAGGMSGGLMAGIAVVLLAAAGGGAWFVLGGGESEPDQPLPFGGKTPPMTTAVAKTDVEPATAEVNETKTQPVETPKKPNLAELQSRALEQMVATSLLRNNNRSKAFCRRLTGEAYALSGNFPGVAEQLTQLDKVNENVPYYKIFPLTTMAWEQLERGDTAAAGGSISRAMEAAGSLPSYGQTRIEAAIALAAVLAATGQADQAAALLRAHRDPGAAGRFAAANQALEDFGTFNFDAEIQSHPVLAWKEPAWVAVTRGLTARGYSEEAQIWAQSAPGPEAQAQCLAAWANVLARQATQNQDPDLLAQVEAATASAAPAAKAYVFARVAAAQLDAGDRAGAEKAIQTAATAIGEVPVPEEYVLLDAKAFLSQDVPDEVNLRVATFAAAEVARVQAQLGQSEAAWKSLAAALGYVRGTAPTVVEVERRQGQIGDRLKNQLRSLLSLDSEDRARLALNDYRKQCTRFLEVARTRFNTQQEILRKAADWNVLDALWNEIQARSDSSTDPNRREPYHMTTIPGIVASRYRQAGAEDQAKAVETAVGGQLKTDVRESVKQTTVSLANSGKVVQAAREIMKANAPRNADHTWLEHWMLRLACRIAVTQGTDAAFEYVVTFSPKRDPLWREAGFRLVAGLATQNGDVEKVAAFANHKGLSATERVSVYRGLVGAIIAQEGKQSTKQVAAEATTTEGK